MEKVEAYRCKECEGKGHIIIDIVKIFSRPVHQEINSTMEKSCQGCKGTGIVWLTEEEVGESQAKEITKRALEILAPCVHVFEYSLREDKHLCRKCGIESEEF